MTDLSRRALLGMGVTAGAGVVTTQAGSAAAAAPPRPANAFTSAVAAPRAAAAAAATRYVTYPGIALVAGTQSATSATWAVYEGNPKGGSWAANNGWVGAAIEVPAGGTIVDVTAYTFGTGKGSLVVDRYLPATSGYVESKTEAITATTTATLTATNVLMDRTLAADEGIHAYVFGTSTNLVVRGIRVGYRPSVAGFVSLAPYRAYDSRYQDGKLGRGSRIVGIANRVRPPSGVVTAMDLVPANAVAIAYNLGVYATEATGYLAVTPPATKTVSASSLNWFGTDQSLSNGLVAQLDGTRTVKVFAGGRGSTHFVIDVLGFYI